MYDSRRMPAWLLFVCAGLLLTDMSTVKSTASDENTHLQAATTVRVQSTAPRISSPDLSFVKGVDASFLQQIEDLGGVYYDDGVPTEALTLFRNHGVNYVRLRLWHTPASGYNDLAHTLWMAQRVKTLGLGLLLDLHYSDTWADPGQQAKPAAWAALPFPELITTVHDYTQGVIVALKAQNTLPDIVQIGNETRNGFLWDDGRVGGSFEWNWPQFVTLLNAAIAGVQDGLTPEESVRIMLHIDRGGDNGSSRWFFDNIMAYDVPFDIIGLSYYPWWHGTLSDLEYNLNDLALRYGRDIIVVETAYPWTLDWYDDTHNIVGLESQLHPGYPAAVAGQRDFLCTEMDVLSNVPDSRGIGLVYWAPDWISVPGMGSPWENLTLFDFQANAWESMDVFRKEYAGLDVQDFAAFQLCYAGAGIPPANPECVRFDYDCDGALDVVDFAETSAALTGP